MDKAVFCHIGIDHLTKTVLFNIFNPAKTVFFDIFNLVKTVPNTVFNFELTVPVLDTIQNRYYNYYEAPKTQYIKRSLLCLRERHLIN